MKLFALIAIALIALVVSAVVGFKLGILDSFEFQYETGKSSFRVYMDVVWLAVFACSLIGLAACYLVDDDQKKPPN